MPGHKPTVVKKYTGFKSNGYAKTVSPKPGETRNKSQLDQIKSNLGKKGK